MKTKTYLLSLGMLWLSMNTDPVVAQVEVLDGLNPIMGQYYEQAYGGDGNEAIMDILELSNGDLILCGWKESSSGDKDMAVWMTDPHGEVVHEFTLGGSKDEIASAIIPNNASGYLLVGRVSNTYTDNDVIVLDDSLKIYNVDAMGNTIWQMTYAEPGWDGEAGMDVIFNGQDFAVLSNRMHDHGNIYGFRVMKIDVNGTIISNTPHGTYMDKLYSHEIMERSGDLLVLTNNRLGIAHPRMYELDLNGAYMNSFDYTFGFPTKMFGMTDYASAGYALAGMQDDGSGLAGFIIELDLNLIMHNIKQLNNAGNQYFRDIQFGIHGYTAVGSCDNKGEGGWDVLLAHYDHLWTELLIETAGGPGDDYGFCVSANPLGNDMLVGGQLLSYPLHGSGNAYYVRAAEYQSVTTLCPKPRAMYVTMCEVNAGVIDNTTGILGDPVEEKALIDFALYNKITYLAMNKTNFIFRTANNGLTRGGKGYRELLNNFLDTARRQGIRCGFVSVGSSTTNSFDSIAKFNQDVIRGRYGYKSAGKVAYLVLEHEFWNAKNTTAYSGNQYVAPVASNIGPHYLDLINDHKTYLNVMNVHKRRDANFLGVHDYVGYFYNRDGSNAAEYDKTNTTHRNTVAKDLEPLSDALFTHFYRKHSSSNPNKAIEFLYPPPISSSSVQKWMDRLSYLGQISTRKTYIFPLFSSEYYISSTNNCANSSSEDYLGKFLQSTRPAGSTPPSFWMVEDTFATQYSNVHSHSMFTHINNVSIGGFIWFKYECRKGKTPFSKTSLVACTSIPKRKNSVSLNQLSGDGIRAYPNPVHDMLYLDAEVFRGQSIQLHLYDMKGKIRSVETEMVDGILTVNLEQMASGMYLLKLTSGQEIRTIKIMKQ